MGPVRHPVPMDDALPQLRPPERLLCGPGPTNVEPAVLEAMTRPMLGHLDPQMHEILLDVVELLRRVYRMPDGLVLPVTVGDWASVLYMAVFAAGLALAAQTWAQAHLSPTRTAIISTLHHSASASSVGKYR